MTTPGRGRGYTGRHHLREQRPGQELVEDLDAVRTLCELSPRSTDQKVDMNKDKDQSLEDKEKMEEKQYKEIKMDPRGLLSPEDEATLKELLTVDEQYTSLLTLLEQFSPGEDGIQFNRKLRHFESTLSNMCPDETRLQQVFSTLTAAALLSSVTARKLAGIGASFTRQQRQQVLRTTLLNVAMQGTYSKLDLLERANPSYLINAANLMGDYFAEARLCNGNKVHILASPLLHYMRSLLASDDIRAHRSLATQLMQNGRELLSVLPQELDDLSISIRLRLLTPPPVSIVWLLLSADLCLNKFLPLPNTLQQFYASHLDLATDENYSEVSYGSWKKSPEKNVDADLAEKVSKNLSQISLNHDEDVKPKLRPILGAGAGLLRQDQHHDTFDMWNKKNSLTKRYDLNSWRQTEEKKEEDTNSNPTVLPTYQVTDFPQSVRYNYPQDTLVNYLQQGDGAYIQTQYATNSNFTSRGDFVYDSANTGQYQENTTQYSDKTAQFSDKTAQFSDMTAQFSDMTAQFSDTSAQYPDTLTNQFPEQTAQFEKAQYQEKGAQFSDKTTQQQYPEKPFSPEKPEFVAQYQNDRPIPERVNNELQKNSARRPVENWRKEKPDAKEDPKNRQKNWTRQRSKDNLEEEEKDGGEKFKKTREVRPGNRLNRRNSNESQESGTSNPGKPLVKRHVTEVPRNHKYWDHDDRCDKDYNS